MTLPIESIHAREVLDSRGRPTIEVELRVGGDIYGRAMVPSGSSTGRHEALELRDGDPRRFGGLGVRNAVRNVNEVIGPKLVGYDARDQTSLDQALISLDGTDDKSRLGANALLGVSLSAARAAAKAGQLPLWRYLGGEQARVLPLPMVNLISGGRHAEGGLDFQDFLIVAVGARSYSEALEISTRVYRSTRDLLLERGLSVLKADEGGFSPALPDHQAAIELLLQGIDRAGLRAGEEVAVALDLAASHFFDPVDGSYRLTAENRVLHSQELIDRLADWTAQFPVVSIEDGLAEDDWPGWQALTIRLGELVQLVGDDLFATNAVRLQRGIEAHAANAVLIKPNQIGTLSETLAVIELGKQAGYRPIISARSGETEDALIADLAVATNAGQIKIGSLAQSDRIAKYNQLLRIEERLGKRAEFYGRNILEPARRKQSK